MPDERLGALEERASSFGSIADQYERWRPGPSLVVAEWLIPADAERVVDLGAGTGKLSRLLVARVPDVVSVEPDPRMREVLRRTVPDATVLDGRGEQIPVEDRSVDAVVVSSAWHWMDVDATVAEVARVLRPGGGLGIVWSGVDWTTGWFAEASGTRSARTRAPSQAGCSAPWPTGRSPRATTSRSSRPARPSRPRSRPGSPGASR